ncbi:MAG: HEAT repeat domain-containing protein [Gemmataceae bacterium]|nr:HEAT repeat domain-containing protein [Gemmataceae bacterium]MCS7269638.1 HEAT repeat domain-containing protein [Gemmataceae bacterium]MDW8242745.1 HEAT repeat domain-containing protein [Thermogemmata sp.]
MRRSLILCLLFAGALLGSGVGTPAQAADPQQIDAAIKKGAEWLKRKYLRPDSGPNINIPFSHALGGTCLAGLALLEAGVPPSDPAVQNITRIVREAAYTQVQTYQISLCLMYLDRLGEPSDEPLIQALAVRLLVGQRAQSGGWGYGCIAAVSNEEVQFLRAIRPQEKKGRLHPDIERYAQALFARKNPQDSVGDDNSNTQFAVLALWLARKHGVPVDSALDLVERRFLMTQTRTGGWPYTGPAVTSAGAAMVAEGSPSMICAGLLGLATGIARRQEKRLKAENPSASNKEEGKGKEAPKADMPDDPFFRPMEPAPKPTPKPAPKPKEDAKATRLKLDARDQAAQIAFAALGAVMNNSVRPDGRGGGAFILGAQGQGHGKNDFYFLWSLERVSLIYGVDKIGNVDWYDAVSTTLVATQAADGSWEVGGYDPEVNTAFAVLVLCKSNLARDLSGKVQNDMATEMRAGPSDSHSTTPGSGNNRPTGGNATGKNNYLQNEAATLAATLLRSSESQWALTLRKIRDSKGSVHTQALALAAHRLEGIRLQDVRNALAERLAGMSAETLRYYAQVKDDPELRRAAVLAMGMKDDKNHVPDLIAALMDEEELVVRAAKASLKALTGQDFGPPPHASSHDKRLAADAWKKWWELQR